MEVYRGSETFSLFQMITWAFVKFTWFWKSVFEIKRSEDEVLCFSNEIHKQYPSSGTKQKNEKPFPHLGHPRGLFHRPKFYESKFQLTNFNLTCALISSKAARKYGEILKQNSSFVNKRFSHFVQVAEVSSIVFCPFPFWRNREIESYEQIICQVYHSKK